MPGKGTVVMFTKAVDALKSLGQFLQGADVPYEWVYVGAVTSQTVQRRGESSVSDDKNDADESNDTQKDYLQRSPFDKGVIIDSGIPEAGLVYADNFLPQQDIWKHKCGHKFVMSHKITNKGRHDNSILLQTAIGKKLHIDDGPADMKMDRITITDEHKNRLVIRTGGDNPDSSTIHTIRNQDYTTEKGSQYMTIMPASKGRMQRDQLGAGDMRDFVAKANYRLTAEKDILRISHKGDIEERADTGDIAYNSSQGNIFIEASKSISLTCGGSTIVMTPDSIAIDSTNISITGTDSVSIEAPSLALAGTMDASIDSPMFTISGLACAITSTTLNITSITTLTGVGGTLNTHMHVGNLGAPTPVIP